MIQKSFTKFNESGWTPDEEQEVIPPFVLLIDDNGDEHPKNGRYEYGVGIFDDEGNNYPAAVDREGTVWGVQILQDGENDGVLKLDGEGFVPGLEKAMKKGFNYFEGFED